MGLTKAFLEIENGPQVPCQFNPTQLAITRGASWPTKVGAAKTAELTFGGASPASMTVELFFDTTDTGQAVSKHTDELLRLVRIDPQLPRSSEDKGNARPPTVTFRWGTMETFKAVVTSLTITFTLISADGVPLRATSAMTLQEYRTETVEPTNPTSGTPHPHRTHRVRPGETLDRIAAGHYGDATAWRRLAAANGITDPLAVRPGTLLAVPEVD